jgi:hypothetical protein
VATPCYVEHDYTSPSISICRGCSVRQCASVDPPTPRRTGEAASGGRLAAVSACLAAQGWNSTLPLERVDWPMGEFTSPACVETISDLIDALSYACAKCEVPVPVFCACMYNIVPVSTCTSTCTCQASAAGYMIFRQIAPRAESWSLPGHMRPWSRYRAVPPIPWGPNVALRRTLYLYMYVHTYIQ